MNIAPEYRKDFDSLPAELRTLLEAELFGFEARTPLRGGLEQTIAWYRAQAPADVPS